MQIKIPPELEPLLVRLREIEVYGTRVEDIAVHLLRNGLAAELRRDGLLRRLTDDLDLERELTEPDVFGEVMGDAHG